MSSNMNNQMRVRMECSDGVVRDCRQILLSNGKVVYRTMTGADPHSYQRHHVQLSAEDIDAAKRAGTDIIKSGIRNRFGKDLLDRE